MSTQRLRLTIAYNGAPFAGWQSQLNGKGVQDALEDAFGKLLEGTASVQGSGRTDAGVHALGQTAHVDVPRGKMSPKTWLAAANAHLPREIRIIRCQNVRPAFHARFSAQSKVYQYRIWNGPVMPPLELGRAWQVPKLMDLPLLKTALGQFVGTHDFAAFAANRGPQNQPTDTVRTIHGISVTGRPGRLITITFHGNGFLYKMVRLLAGSAVRVAQKKAPLSWLTGLLPSLPSPAEKSTAQNSPPRQKSSFAAPAEGLYLVKVHY